MKTLVCPNQHLVQKPVVSYWTFWKESTQALDEISYEDPLNDGFKIELNEMPVLVCFHCSNFSFRFGRKLKNVENLQKTAEASPALGQWPHKAH